MLIRQKKCLFHGNKLLALPERDPSFFIRYIHAREAPLFSRHQEIIFLALFTVSRLQTRAVGKNPQRRVTGIDQRAVGVLIAEVGFSWRDHQDGADPRRSGTSLPRGGWSHCAEHR